MRAAGLLLPALLIVLPFEPRRPTVSVLGLQITVLEAAAALVVLAVALLARDRILDTWRRRPWPLVALAAYAAAHLLSAALAAPEPALSFRFALRMAAMAAFGAVVAGMPDGVRRRGFGALAAGAMVVAALAVGEGLGGRGLDAILSWFREAPVTVAGVRRATAGSEHPNLAGAFLMYGLLAAVGLWYRTRPRLVLAVTLCAACGMAFTYSRGAAAAIVVGAMALAARDRAHGRVPAAAALVVAAVAGLFSLAAGGWRPAAGLDARYVPADRALHLEPGERRRVRVEVTNTGRAAWPMGSFALSYHWLRAGAHSTVDGPRPPLPAAVAPGQTVAAQVELTAPADRGAYRLVWDLVRDDGTWLSGEGVPPAVVGVVVGAGEAAAAQPLGEALVWQPSRVELWALALRMWRQHPVLGIGPDNFRRSYGPAAGRSFWDDRAYANQTLLEAGATTGLLGAFALGATLVLTLWTTARSARPDAAPAFAVAAGIAAHGLVDYVLAMTGHYLVLGWVVGAASAAEPRA